MLEGLSEKEKISVNTIANRALRKHVEYDSLADKFGLVTISRKLLGILFASLPEEQCRALGKESGRDGGPAFIIFWFKKFDLSTTMMAIQKITAEYGKNFHFQSHYDGRTYTFVMKHDCGFHASAYYAESVKAVLALLNADVEVDESEDQVVARFRIVKSSFQEREVVVDKRM